MPEKPSRLSHSALLAREWKTSIEAARAAVKCDAQPAHFAFLALCLERQKGGEQEGRDAAAAAVAANWDYPPFLAVLSQAELRCGNIEAAREAISKARAILPQQGRYALSFASLSVSLGDKAASLSALKELYLMRKLPKSSHALLHAQLVEAGDLELARSVLKDEAELEKSTLEAED
jgi:hypothetical protein